MVIWIESFAATFVGVIKQTEDRRMGIQAGGNGGSVNVGGWETGGRHLIAG